MQNGRWKTVCMKEFLNINRHSIVLSRGVKGCGGYPPDAIFLRYLTTGLDCT